MDQSVDKVLGDQMGMPVPRRHSAYNRSRHAIARFTALMVVLCAGFALVAGYLGTRFVDERGARAPTAEFGEAPSAEIDGLLAPAAPTIDAADVDATTTTESTSERATPEPTAPTTAAPTTASPSTDAPTTAAPTTEAPATTNAPATAAPSDQSPTGRGRLALDVMTYPWETRLPGWTIEFQDGRSGLYGLTLVDDKRIEIYVRSDQSQDLLVHIVAHEIGHAVDVTLNDGPDRRRWQGARGIGGEPWWPDSAASDFDTGAGDFAESFAYWQAPTSNYRSKLGPAPSADQLQLLAELAYG